MVVPDSEYTRTGVFETYSYVFGNDGRIQCNTHTIHTNTLSRIRYIMIHCKYSSIPVLCLNTVKYSQIRVSIGNPTTFDRKPPFSRGGSMGSMPEDRPGPDATHGDDTPLARAPPLSSENFFSSRAAAAAAISYQPVARHPLASYCLYLYL